MASKCCNDVHVHVHVFQPCVCMYVIHSCVFLGQLCYAVCLCRTTVYLHMECMCLESRIVLHTCLCTMCVLCDAAIWNPFVLYP